MARWQNSELRAFNLNAFDQQDWDAFAGAEYLGPGQPPLIGEVGKYVVIVSGQAGSRNCSIVVEFNAIDAIYNRTVSTLANAYALVGAARLAWVEFSPVPGEAELGNFFKDFGFDKAA